MACNGILCLEGDWDEGLARKRTVRPVLDLLKSQSDVPFIHRNASTRAEFTSVIRQWSLAKYRDYPILYLAFHGQAGCLQVEGVDVPMGDFHEFFKQPARGRVIHFGACQTIQTDKRALRNFLKRSHFSALSGFREDVDWLEACALELIVLSELAHRQITSQGLLAAHQAIRRKAGSLANLLQFRLFRSKEV
jgi:hypothetical protein